MCHSHYASCCLLQKLIIDEKKFYLFGRNPDLCDFTIDHQSCSRVHAALVYHRHLKRVFLIDLSSSECRALQQHGLYRSVPISSPFVLV